MQRRAPEAEAFIAIATLVDGSTKAVSLKPTSTIKDAFDALWPTSFLGVEGRPPVSIALVPDSAKTPADELLTHLEPPRNE